MAAAADMCGIPRRRLASIARGYCAPTPGEIVSITQGLGISMNDVIGFDIRLPLGSELIFIRFFDSLAGFHPSIPLLPAAIPTE